jgi:hypothetical protein
LRTSSVENASAKKLIGEVSMKQGLSIVLDSSVFVDADLTIPDNKNQYPKDPFVSHRLGARCKAECLNFSKTKHLEHPREICGEQQGYQ